MAKKIIKKIKIQAPAAKATPAPPLGPVLGQAGINIGEFINKFNTETQAEAGNIVAVEVSVFEDRTFALKYKTPPVTGLILKAIGKEKGSGSPLSNKIGTITKEQIRKIAEKKMPDLNANDIEAAMKIVEGSCRSMGVEVK